MTKTKSVVVTPEMMAMRNEWDDEKQDMLDEQEGIIESGRPAFEKVASALSVIKKEGLYLKDHSSFREYCEERWGFTRQWADKLISAADVGQLLDEVNTGLARSEQAGVEILQKSPVSVKAKLAGLTPRTVKNVAKKIIEVTDGEIPTGKEVQKAVAQVTHTPIKEAPEKKEDPVAIAVIKRLTEQIEDLKERMARKEKVENPNQLKPLKATLENHPVIIAMDNEWAAIVKSMAYSNVKPADMFKRLKMAVERALL